MRARKQKEPSRDSGYEPASKRVRFSDTAPSWADVARNAAAKDSDEAKGTGRGQATAATGDSGKGKGKGKGLGSGNRAKGTTPASRAPSQAPKPATPTKPQSQPHTKSSASYTLLRGSWGPAAFETSGSAKASLEKGDRPAGSVIPCRGLEEVRDLQRLAQLHSIAEAPVALVWVPVKPSEEQPLGGQLLHLPTWENGGPGVRKLWVFPLLGPDKPLPKVPRQPRLVSATKGPAEKLEAYRVTVVRSLVTKDRWETTKRNPHSMIRSTLGEAVHSCYGWRELQTGSSTDGEVTLQGFLRTTATHAEAVQKANGVAGTFYTRLANSNTPRPPVWWVPRADGEGPAPYYQRVLEDSQKQNVPIALRLGGGAFLGLRLEAGKAPPQVRAWTLHGAPRGWFQEDVLRCLKEADCAQTSILRPPGGKRRSWLLKTAVPEEDATGIFSIQDTHAGVLLLNRVNGKGARKEEVLSVIKTPRRAEVASDAKEPLSSPHQPEAEGAGRPESSPAANTDRERSPRAQAAKAAKAPDPALTSPVEEVDCGALGNCGYLCLAAALALEQGRQLTDIRADLPTRARTIRNDLYKHLQKHKNEYEEWFEPDPRATEQMEAGPPPKDWGEFLEATLRDGRWVCGLSLLAASKRYGIHIIVVPTAGSAKDTPMCFGEPRAAKEPVILFLKQGHYTLGKLKEGRAWPRDWLAAEKASVVHAMFRAGGKRTGSVSAPSPDTPCKSRTSWRPDTTPSSAALEGRPASALSWRPAETPPPSRKRQGDGKPLDAELRYGQEEAWRPPGTPSADSQAAEAVLRLDLGHQQAPTEGPPRTGAAFVSAEAPDLEVLDAASWRPAATPPSCKKQRVPGAALPSPVLPPPPPDPGPQQAPAQLPDLPVHVRPKRLRLLGKQKCFRNLASVCDGASCVAPCALPSSCRSEPPEPDSPPPPPHTKVLKRPASQPAETDWRCPVCGFEARGATKDHVLAAKRRHCQTKHPDVPWKTFLSRPFIQVIVASNQLPEAERDWQCPYCDCALPLQPTRARMLAVTAHRKQAHPRIPVKTWKAKMCSLRFAGRPKTQRHTAALTRRGAETRQRLYPTHSLVEVLALDTKAAAFRSPSQFWCRQCLAKLGGYGGNSKAQNEKLTCAQVKALPKAHIRVRRAWGQIQHRPTKDGQPLWEQLSPWVRNLLEDGDINRQPGPCHLASVASCSPGLALPPRGGLTPRLLAMLREKLVWDGIQPHPGPRSRRGSQQRRQAGTTMWSLNVGGGVGTWRVLDTLSHYRPDVVLLQETALQGSEAAGFQTHARKVGYHSYFSGAQLQAHRPHGGAMVLVKTSLCSRPAWSFTDKGGAAQAVWVNGALLTSVYLAPVPESSQVVDEVAAVVLSLPVAQQWALGGDFNCLPAENPFHLSLDGLGGCASFPPNPTRWDGHRCIDYFLGTLAFVQVHTLPDKLSDHTIVQATWTEVTAQHTPYALSKYPVLPAPQVPEDQWQAMVGQHWAARTRHPQSDSLDAVWRQLNYDLFQALCGAHQDVGWHQHQPPAAQLRRGKPTHVEVTPQEQPRHLASGAFTSYRQRSLRRLLGRMLQLRQRRSSPTPTPQSATQQHELLTRIERSPGYDPAASLTDNIRHVTQSLEQCQQDENTQRLRRWKQRVTDDKHAFKWLRRQPPDLTHAIKTSPGDTPASSVQEALAKLRGFWCTIWRRPELDVEAVWPEILALLPQPRPAAAWQPLTGADLRQAALACRGTAAGPDGWTAEELLQFHPDMFQALADFYNLCESRGALPATWTNARQVHLGKGKPREPDGSILTKNMRPISITSMMWRVCSKARFRSPDTQTWLRNALPPYVYGGVPGQGTQDAVGPLLRKTQENWYVGTLDLSMAFDLASPVLAARVMKHLGMDPRLTALLLHAWTHQTRWLQLMGETLPQGTKVATSLPQGDCFSMLAMACILLPAAAAVQRDVPDTTQVIYADDRSFACPSAGKVAQVARVWADWAVKLGLSENQAKAQFFHPQAAGRRRLTEAGFDAAQVSDRVRILGFTFQGVQARSADPYESQRIREANVKASRCRCLPGTLERRIRLAKVTVTAKASWGWMFRRPSLRDASPYVAACRRLMRTPVCGSPHLCRLLRGHQWDIRFMAVSTTVSVLHRHLARSGMALPPWPRSKSGWVGALRRGMLDIGWQEVQAWHWRHPRVAQQLVLDPTHPQWEPQQPTLQHALRESWRFGLFALFTRQPRRDAPAGAFFEPARLRAILKLPLDSHRRAVLVGAAISPACYLAMARRQGPGSLQAPRCPFCNCSPERATWLHCAWQCTAAPRPQGVQLRDCHDTLQRRLGWPTGLPGRTELDSAILGWLATVRRITLQLRRGP
jgi:hypothetical protein